MSPSVIALLAIQGIGILLLIVLAVQAFRTHPGWGVFPVLMLAPFVCGLLHVHSAVAGLFALPGLIGLIAFAIKHREKAAMLFLLYLGCCIASAVMMFTSPPVIAYFGQRNPALASAVKTVNPSAYDEAQKLSPSGEKLPEPKPTPREVRDLAENEVPSSATPPPDPNAAPRAAYTKHAKELSNLYKQLDAERGKLKAGSSAVAAFNAKAAKYQQGLTALADEKAKLDALDHAANLNTDAALALASLQASAASGDYEAFDHTLKKALDEYRQTPSFPAIAAFARTALAQATGDKVAAGLKDKAARSARADFDKTTRQIQGIVNQTPAIVANVPPGSETYHYTFHPGATHPDFNAENLQATRELWKGQYVNMDEAPGVFYRSADCEFNPQTKYFYTSRNVPKKRLSDAEYKELTRLYHLLGQQEKAVAAAAPPSGQVDHVTTDLAALKVQLDTYAMK